MTLADGECDKEKWPPWEPHHQDCPGILRPKVRPSLVQGFPIGSYFRTAHKAWLVTDQGTRVLIAIEPTPGWTDGPPYGGEEVVFDEHDIQAIRPIEPQPGRTMDETIASLDLIQEPDPPAWDFLDKAIYDFVVQRPCPVCKAHPGTECLGPPIPGAHRARFTLSPNPDEWDRTPLRKKFKPEDFFNQQKGYPRIAEAAASHLQDVLEDTTRDQLRAALQKWTRIQTDREVSYGDLRLAEQIACLAGELLRIPPQDPPMSFIFWHTGEGLTGLVAPSVSAAQAKLKAWSEEGQNIPAETLGDPETSRPIVVRSGILFELRLPQANEPGVRTGCPVCGRARCPHGLEPHRGTEPPDPPFGRV